MGNYYNNANNYIDRIDLGVWVELGVDRGEGSTQFFSQLAKEKATRFYAVDADIDQVTQLHSKLSVDGRIPDHIEIVHSTGETFLQTYSKTNEKISLVYLDNFDWDYELNEQGNSNGRYEDHKANYRNKFNLEMTNLNSQAAHLIQAVLLVSLNLLSNNSLIICDDTWYIPQEGIYSGKCSAAIPYLLNAGFQMVDQQGSRNSSGCILARFSQ
jgi:hypothetical protein